MTVLARETRRWISGSKPILIALLALAMLVPLGMLYLDHNRHQADSRSAAAQERDGIEYLLALSQLTIALTDAQSAAVRSESVSEEALTRAVAATAEMDDRFGEELRVRERWARLRNMIEQITSTAHSDARAAYTSYEEAADLLLDMHTKLRETTGLVRDADADTYYLQDAAGEELPEAVVAAARLVDLVTIAATDPADERGSAREPAANATEISVALAAVTSPLDDLAVGIQAALDSTDSRTLSSNVLGRFDQFLRTKDDLLGLVPPDGNVENVDIGQLTDTRAQLQTDASELLTALLTEMDTLIENRENALARGQRTAIGAVVVSVLLAFAVAALSLSGWLNRHRGAETAAGPGAGSGASGADGSGGSVPTRGTPEYVPVSSTLDTMGGHAPGPGASPATDRLASELIGTERADVR